MSENASKCPRCGAELPPGPKAGPCPRCAAQFLQATQTEALGEPSGPRPRFTPPPVSELASLFPQLEIIELVGQGGMGAVYKARQKELDRMVALKVLPPDIGQEASFAERFAREAKALAKLNHPAIVTLYEFGRADSGAASLAAPPQPLYYFLMEFVNGVNLRQVLEGERMSPREALAIVPQICDALQYAHDQGIVHRDIKPENILLDRQGHVKVADFGLAKLVGTAEASDGGVAALSPASTGADTVMGTPQYMAPEQREHPTEVDHRADIYSLGVVFYQMLTGELPVAGKIEAPSRKVIVDVRLDEVVLRTLERDPERRYQQASRVKEDVETIASTSPGVQSAGGQEHSSASATAIDKSCRAIVVPAIGLITSGVVDLLPLVAGILWAVSHNGSIAIVVASVFIAAAGVVVIVGALHMLRLQADRLSVGASILAMIMPPGFLFGLPFGLWALILLRREDVPRPIRTDEDPEARLFRQLVFRAARRQPNLARMVSFLLLVALALGGLVLATDYARRKSQTRARNQAVNHGLAGEARERSDFKVTLTNGITLEVVAVARNPRGTNFWWRPDGTPLASPPVNILELPKMAPTTQSRITIIPENEFLVYVRRESPPGVVIESFQPHFAPRPSDTEFAATVQEVRTGDRASAELVCFAEPPDTVDYQEAIACGPWEAVSSYDVATKTTRDLTPGIMALWSEPRYEHGALRFDVMHNANRDEYALRMVARLRGGRSETLVFHTGVLTGSPAKGFALIHGSEVETSRWLRQARELLIERTPWVRGGIRNIRLSPKPDGAGPAASGAIIGREMNQPVADLAGQASSWQPDLSAPETAWHPRKPPRRTSSFT